MIEGIKLVVRLNDLGAVLADRALDPFWILVA